MHIMFLRAAMLAMLKLAVPVTDGKSPMPALNNLLIDASGTTLSVTATDLYRSVHGSIADGVVVTKPGRIALPAKGLLQRVEAMPEGPIEITVGKDEATVIRSGVRAKLSYKMTGLPADQFPVIASPKDGASWFSLPGEAVKSLLTRTLFCASEDNTRPSYNCVCVTTAPGKLQGGSSDGHRAAIVSVSVEDVEQGVSLVIPKNGAEHLRKLVDEAAAQKLPIEVLIAGSDCFFRVKDTRYSVKLTNAEPPPYERFVPKDQIYKVKLPRKALIDSVKATTIAASDATGEVIMTFGANEVIISASDAAKGEGSDTLAIDYDGPKFSLGFFSPYITAVLDRIDADEIIFESKGAPKVGTTEGNPVTIAPSPMPEGQTTVFLVLPLYQ